MSTRASSSHASRSSARRRMTGGCRPGGPSRRPDEPVRGAGGHRRQAVGGVAALYNPTAIDVDARGRVWVAEAVNYRQWNGRNPGLAPRGRRSRRDPRGRATATARRTRRRCSCRIRSSSRRSASRCSARACSSRARRTSSSTRTTTATTSPDAARGLPHRLRRPRPRPRRALGRRSGPTGAVLRGRQRGPAPRAPIASGLDAALGLASTATAARSRRTTSPVSSATTGASGPAGSILRVEPDGDGPRGRSRTTSATSTRSRSTRSATCTRATTTTTATRAVARRG